MNNDKVRLIIEIDKEVYKNVKDKKFFISPWVDTAITNAIPYNPSDDLISRSSLLNQIDTTDWGDVRLLVEDAPSVEPICPYLSDSDLISREALLDQIDTTDWDNVRTLVEDAQTVEPICPYLSNDDVKQPCLNSPCERPQGDCISRKLVINKLNEAQVEYDEYYMGLGKAKQIVDELPIIPIPDYKEGHK